MAMKLDLLTRSTPLDHKVREPTLLALVLTITALAALLAGCLALLAALPAFGSLWWAGTVIALVLLCLLVAPRLAFRSGPGPATARQRFFRRALRLGRALLLLVLACWLGLIAWVALAPGGPAPGPKASPDEVRVITWNIHCGQDHGPPWKRFDWPARRQALRLALEQARPDVLCVQEATPEQVRFLERSLPDHERAGIGRDGAEAGGEHCAVFFRRDRFERLAGDTFWLEEPTDRPRPGSALGVKRICTWARLRDRSNGRALRVYNTHLYLTEAPRTTAAEHILAHIAAGDPGDAVVLTADFNAPPSAPSRRRFLEAGLIDSAAAAGQKPGRPTFQLYGIGLWCIDGILVDRHWRVHDQRILAWPE
jgi:endonuclease/exonuclease/phosphatase family metal-dependent hydrolase